MESNGEKFNAKEYLDGLQKKSEAAEQNLRFKKERLKQKILKSWNQYSSIFFWEQAFLHVPFDVLEQTFQNVLALEKSGYPVKTRAGLFVSTLKKMGYFPFKKEVTDGSARSAKSNVPVSGEEGNEA